MAISVRPLSNAVGAEALDIDLSDTLEADDFDKVYEAFLEFGLLAFRRQHITPDEQIKFSSRFGAISVHPMQEARHPDHPELIVIQNKTYRYDEDPETDSEDKEGDKVGVIPWHSDLTYTTKPSVAAVLYAIAVPPEGGETGFIDIARVYDALPTRVQHQIEDLEAVHWLGTDAGPADARFDKVVHPLVLIHPESRRKGLNVSPFFIREIVGMDKKEGRQLLDWLIDFTLQPEFIYYHTWEVGDAVIWDNRRTMHHATGWDHRHRRILHRTTIGGVYDFAS